MAVRVSIVIAILQLYRVLLVLLVLVMLLVMLRRVAEGVLLGDWRDGQAVVLLVMVDGDSSITGSTTGAVDVGMRRIVVARRRREARHSFFSVRAGWAYSSAARLSVQSRENSWW
jgi:hypothetical protein